MGRKLKSNRPIAWGVDCAFRSVAIAVVELGQTSDRDHAVHVEALLTKASDKKLRVMVADDDARCIREIATWLDEMFMVYEPIIICAELPSGAQGAKAHHALGIAKGVLCTFAVLRGGLPMAVCSPKELKTATTGNAGASKEAVMAAMGETYVINPPGSGPVGLRFHPTKKRWEHEADALGAYHACRNSDLVRMARRTS